MFTRAVMLAVSCAVILGCGMDGPDEPAREQQEIIANLEAAGFPGDDIAVVGGKVYVGRDAEVSLAASREMLQDGGPGGEQYRTSNLVGAFAPTVICIVGDTFTGALSAGLDAAIANYTDLFVAGRIRLLFVRIDSSPVPLCQFLIGAVVEPGLVGGVAGFPFQGRPFHTIRIGDGLIPFGVNVIAHVITHELGHTIGLRHSDFFNRSISCGGAAVNEESPPTGLGAILIPSTPSGAVVGGSVMNSCFRFVETGEFTATDVTALDVLY